MHRLVARRCRAATRRGCACSPSSTWILRKPCVSPFSTARATRVIGRLPTSALMPALLDLGLAHADAPERRVGVERVDRDAVGVLAAGVRQQVVGDDLVVVVRGVGEGALAVAVAERPDARVGGAQALVDLDVAALVGLDAGRVQAEVVGVGHPADGEQEVACRARAARLPAVEADGNAVRRPSARSGTPRSGAARCLRRRRISWIASDTSSSSRATSRGPISTTVTRLPKRRNICANSSPT